MYCTYVHTYVQYIHTYNTRLWFANYILEMVSVGVADPCVPIRHALCTNTVTNVHSHSVIAREAGRLDQHVVRDPGGGGGHRVCGTTQSNTYVRYHAANTH